MAKTKSSSNLFQQNTSTYLLLGAMLVIGFFLGAQFGINKSMVSRDGTEDDIADQSTVAPTENLKMGYGILDGSLSYPSEVLPDQTVCAENITTGEVICTDNNITDKKYTYGKGYRLEVPTGVYEVYARIDNPGNNPQQKIYYSDFVLCGFHVDCPSHDPIDVYVSAGEVKENVDPQDWYNY